MYVWRKRRFFEKELTLRNIRLLRNYEPELRDIMSEPNQIRQVIVNMLNNAVDAIDKSGEISITTMNKDKYVCIQITDTGCGISPEKIDKIFMPFFTTKPTGKGTGLGLSVSYGIIKSLGGTIGVESIPEKGTTFRITLPINN